jgi:hypothetical protein
MIVLRDYKKAKRRALTRGEFIDVIETRGAAEAAKIYREYCRIQPRHNLIVSSAVGPLYMDAFECGDYKEALAICELWESGLPNDPGPLFSKARVYAQTNELDKAIACYERIISIDKEEKHRETFRERMRELRSRKVSGASVRIRWLGQSSFLMTTSGGTTILTDPVDFKGYKLPPGTTADIVTVSHEHVDHNAVGAVSGTPAVFRGTDKRCHAINAVDTTIAGVRLYSVTSFHDPGHHGVNAVFIFEFNGIRVAHLGDIGTTLADGQVEAIGPIDVLMIPVGGQYTVGWCRRTAS